MSSNATKSISEDIDIEDIKHTTSNQFKQNQVNGIIDEKDDDDSSDQKILMNMDVKIGWFT